MIMNNIRNIKNKSPNIYIIIVGLCIACWFRGVNMIINNIITNDTIITGLILIIVSTLILYLDDSSLSELRNISNEGAINNK